MSPPSAGLAVLLCTFPSQESARTVARAVLEERLAACAQLDAPMESLYWWEGELSSARETRLWLKSLPRLIPALRARIAELHPYSVPQILDLSAEANADYLAWLQAECRREPS